MSSKERAIHKLKQVPDFLIEVLDLIQLLKPKPLQSNSLKLGKKQ